MSKRVYVGRIPFDMTEEQLEDIFKSAGPIQQTRLMFDKVTGKSKGFAFIQYYDAKSASSAIRNLDNHKVGNLRLKVNYSAGGFQASKGDTSAPNQEENSNEDGSAIPDIVNAVSSLTAQYKIELLAELKQIIISKPESASLLLSSNPQLSYAIVQSLFELNLIDADSASSLILGDSLNGENSIKQQPSSLNHPGGNSTETYATPHTSGTPLQRLSNTSNKEQETHFSSNKVSKNQNVPMDTPVAPNPALEQRKMFRQIMELTDEQLNMMTPEQRAAALGVRQKILEGEIVI